MGEKKAFTAVALAAPIVWGLIAGYQLASSDDYKTVSLAALAGVAAIAPAIFAIKARLRVIYPLNSLGFYLGGLMVHADAMQKSGVHTVGREMHRTMLDAYGQLELLEKAENSIFFSLSDEERARLSEARTMCATIFQSWEAQR